jgi:hypothetical protein
MNEYIEKLQRIAKTIDSSIKVVPKTHWVFQPSIQVGRLFCVDITDCGGAFGNYVGIPDGMDLPSATEMVVHECYHVRQKRLLGLGIPFIGHWIGSLVMFLLCLLPFPVLLSWFKFRFELNADDHMCDYLINVGELSPQYLDIFSQERAKEISSATYGWAWPYPWTLKAYKKCMEKKQ